MSAMKMMMRVSAGTVMAILVMAAPADAFIFGAPKAKTGPLTRDQVRVRILDQCVLSQSGKDAGQGAGPKCNCYAAKISKALTDQEVATFRKMPKRLSAEASTTFATCK